MDNAKILIVEDESIVALDIKLTLESLQYLVTGIAKNFTQALEKIEILLPELILMDINLKKSQDGIDTVLEIQKKYDIPIIYLTAYTDEKTIRRAVQTNPVGYLVKPFNPEELNATIQLGLYKSKHQLNTHIKEEMINLGHNYHYDTFNEIFFYDNHPIKLSKNEHQLLKLLIDAKGNIVSHTDIEYYIWPDEAVNHDVLRSLVYRLRTKFNHQLIETVPSFGYKILL